MRNIITPAVLSTMIPQEFEDWRDGGEDLRRERGLTLSGTKTHVKGFWS
ncbi:recombinase [Salmonella enterica subsp. enterica serovar Enteritidis]|nr:recombinase [Salmonella enterica subsp. enterica serovar Enteritidis]EDE0756733.1 recombinase [Salmonella enterica subsp. enterica serovar Enteritidis]